MLSILEALAALPDSPPPCTAESCALTDALGRILAESLIAPEDSPTFPKALMDGFAVHNSALTAPTDSAGLTELRVTDTLLAGQMPRSAPSPGQALRIMTGAVTPDGTAAVIPIEMTEFREAEPERLRVNPQELQAGMNILPRAANIAAGTELLSSGTILHPGRIAALAEFGITTVPVYRQPRVAVLPTGDEVVHFSRQPPPGHIRNSSQPMLASQARSAGAVPILLDPVPDQPHSLADSIRTGLLADVLLLTGGVSMGTHDFVPQELERAGVRKIFHGIRMKPGKPLWFGIAQQDDHTCLVFGLPGNPVSSLVCFELFVRPLLCRLQKQPAPERHRAALTMDFSVRGNRPVCQPAQLSLCNGRLQATPLNWKVSADLNAITAANGMVLLNPEDEPAVAGQTVPAWYWYSNER